MRTIENLQTLRGVAAALVVLHHLRDILAPNWPWVKDIHMGAAGVDIFFVLSGVVITLSEWGRPADARHFVLRRILRVAPLYWCVLALVGAMLIVGLSPVGVQTADATVVNWLKSAFFVPFERSHGAIIPLLGVGWTLNYEMFFYLVFAVIIFLPAPLRSAALVGIMLVLVAIGFVTEGEGVMAVFYTNPILLEFAAGVLLATWWMRSQPGRLDRTLGLGVLVVGALGLLCAAQPQGFEQLMPERALFWGIPSGLIVAGAMLCERAGARINGPFWMTLGAASYAVYLIHTPVLQVVGKLAQAAGLFAGGTLAILGVALVGFVVSHIVGYLLHLWIERPLSRTLSHGLRLSRRAVSGSASS